MVPYGVPEVTLDQSDLVPLRITRCLCPVRKCLSQACKQPSIPLLFNFSRRGSWGTLSNALARSRKTWSAGRDKLRDLAQSFSNDNSCVTLAIPFRKPNWLLFIRPVSCQNLCNLPKPIFLPDLQTIEVREIEWQFSERFRALLV